jgi:hypothetical protein
MPIAVACLLVAVSLLVASEGRAAFGSPILETGRFGLGIVTRHYTRDTYDVRRDQLSNPEDSFGYVAFDVRLGVWRDRLELGIELGRAHNKEDDFPERDLITYEMGFTLRGLVYEPADQRFFVVSGLHYRDTVGFDRGVTLTHKLRRNLVGFGYIGRPIEIAGRQGRIYAGPHYSHHEFFDYGAFFQESRGPGEGETRDDLQIAVGTAVQLLPRLELGGEVTYRSNLSFAVTGSVTF